MERGRLRCGPGEDPILSSHRRRATGARSQTQFRTATRSTPWSASPPRPLLPPSLAPQPPASGRAWRRQPSRPCPPSSPPTNLKAQETPAADLLTVGHYLDMERVGDPRISPDGTRIVFTRSWVNSMEDRFDSEIRAMDADGGRQRFLVEGSNPRWSPDGTRIAYLAPGDPGGQQIHVRWMDAEARRPRSRASCRRRATSSGRPMARTSTFSAWHRTRIPGPSTFPRRPRARTGRRRPGSSTESTTATTASGSWRRGSRTFSASPAAGAPPGSSPAANGTPAPPLSPGWAPSATT